MVRLSLNVDQETIDNSGRDDEPVPAGKYEVKIFEIKADEVKNGDNKGKLRLKFHFRIEDGQESPDGRHQGNRRIFADVNAFPGVSKLTGEPTPPYDLLTIAKAIGVSAEDLADIDTEEWLGEALQVTVAHKKKQHQVDGQWVDIEPAEYRAVARSFRSLESVEASATAAATVVGKTGATPAAGAKAGGKAKPTLIKL
jgi:hypothetical protein